MKSPEPMALAKEICASAGSAELVLFANTGGTEGMSASRDLYMLNILHALGGLQVDRMVRLEGGLDGWKAAGFAVEAAKTHSITPP